MIQLKPDQARLSALLKDTITLMCKNGLTFNSKFSIDCVIGVTLDEKEAFYISMNNIIKSEEANMGSDTSQEESHSGHPRKKRRKRSRSRECKTELGGNMGDSMGEEGPSLPSKRELSDEDSEDNAIVFIKEEPKGWDQSPDTFQNPVHSEPQLDSHGGFPYTGADISQDSNLSLGDTFMPMSNQHMLQGSSGGSPYPPHTVGGQPPGGIAGGLTGQSPGQSSQINQFRLDLGSPVGGRARSKSRANTTPNASDDLSQFMASWSDSVKSPSSTKSKISRHCEICDKLFTSQYGYQVHLKRHAGIHPYTCEVCGKGMSSKSNYDEHMRHHTGITLNCAKCDRAFITQRAYKTHILTCK